MLSAQDTLVPAALSNLATTKAVQSETMVVCPRVILDEQVGVRLV